jgi:hypothetical protein
MKTVILFIFLIIILSFFILYFFYKILDKTYNIPNITSENIKDRKTYQNLDKEKLKSKKREIKEKESVFSNHYLNLDVVGIFANKNRIGEFKKLTKSSRLSLKLDNNNKHDKYAVEVLTDNGKQLGYLTRAQRKLFRTLKGNNTIHLKIGYINSYYSDFHKDYKYFVSINIYIGFEQEDLNLIIKLECLKDSLNNLYQEKKHKQGVEVSEEIITYFLQLMNNKIISKKYQKGKLPLAISIDKITINAIKSKAYSECVNFYDSVVDFMPKNERIIKRVAKAKEKLLKQ